MWYQSEVGTVPAETVMRSYMMHTSSPSTKIFLRSVPLTCCAQSIIWLTDASTPPADPSGLSRVTSSRSSERTVAKSPVDQASRQVVAIAAVSDVDTGSPFSTN